MPPPMKTFRLSPVSSLTSFFSIKQTSRWPLIMPVILEI
jgi:hypothetical protein